MSNFNYKNIQMRLKNTRIHYGIIAITFHWMTFAFVIFMFPMGYIMTNMPLSPNKLEIYSWHKSLGFILLVLIVLRLSWRIFNHQPETPKSISPAQKIAARLVHYLLYAFLFALPITGWLMSSAAGFPVVVFKIFQLPDLIQSSESLRLVFLNIHFAIGIAMLSLILIHILAAMYHHFYKRDIILHRILPIVRVNSK